MNRIILETIEKYWRKINAQSDEGVIFEVLKELYDRQPLLMTYLTVADKNSLNEDERQMMYYLGSFVIHLMLHESSTIAEVTEEEWEKVRRSNLRMLEFVASEDSPKNFRRSMDDVIDTHNQTDLLRFILDLVMNDHSAKSILEKTMSGEY